MLRWTCPIKNFTGFYPKKDSLLLGVLRKIIFIRFSREFWSFRPFRPRIIRSLYNQEAEYPEAEYVEAEDEEGDGQLRPPHPPRSWTQVGESPSHHQITLQPRSRICRHCATCSCTICWFVLIANAIMTLSLQTGFQSSLYTCCKLLVFQTTQVR